MREEVRNQVVQMLKERLTIKPDPTKDLNLQLGTFTSIVDTELTGLSQIEKKQVKNTVREIIQEFINNGLLYVGLAGNMEGYPWLTLTEYGRKCILEDKILPYDPEGYLDELKKHIPSLDSVTFAYISEAIVTYNRRLLLSSTITLGAASENLILILIDSYAMWISDMKRKKSFERKIDSVGIYKKFEEFKKEVQKDIKTIPKDLTRDLDTYLDTIFNFIRLNRNKAGHPTGKELSAKTVYSNLQIFAEYASAIFTLIEFFKK